MLRSIALENFKAYERLGELELRPLTVFCGANAAGKSSVIQALLMMKQTMSQPTEGHAAPLVTDGEDVSLGDYANLLFGHDLTRALKIELTVPVAWGERGFWEKPVSLTLVFEYATDVPDQYAPDPGKWEWLFRFRSPTPGLVSLRLTARGDDGQELVTVVTGPRYDEYGRWGWQMDLTFGEQIRRSDRHFEFPEIGERIEDAFKETRGDGVTLTEWADDCGAEDAIGLVSRMLHEASRRMTVRYVGPEREAPQRYYDVDERSMRSRLRSRGQGDWKTDITQFGEFFQAREPSGRPLRMSESERLCTDSQRKIPFIPGRKPLDELVNSWLTYLGLPEVHPVIEGRDYRFTVKSPYAEKCSVFVTDTGYGVSQVIPILLAGLAWPEEIVVLDQPELHLHPKVQTGIADFAIAISESRQVLVETHSDHFVNRIVRRVVEGQIKSDDVAVYFFTPTSDGPHVEMVEVDPTYGIKNWPLGFFDDYANEQEAIIRASLERRAKGDST